MADMTPERLAELRAAAPGDDATELAITVHQLLDALEAKTAEVEAAERQLAIRAEDSIARRLAMATVAEVGTETAAGDTADTLAELLIEAERERDEARAEVERLTLPVEVEWDGRWRTLAQSEADARKVLMRDTKAGLIDRYITQWQSGLQGSEFVVSMLTHRAETAERERDEARAEVDDLAADPGHKAAKYWKWWQREKARADRAEAALERVRELHQRRLGYADDWDTCTCGYDECPCPTIQAIEGADDA